jgi:hypothetical protein
VIGEKLKDKTNVDIALNTFFITLTKKLDIEQIEKGDI